MNPHTLYQSILLGILVIILSGCNSLFFFPHRQEVIRPDRLGLPYENVYTQVAAGITLHGWFIPALQEPRGTIIFFHGNAENISTHIGAVYWLPAQGYNVYLYDYRGYGKSDGTPDIGEVIRDVPMVLDKLITRADVDPSNLIVFGQSLGGAIALNGILHWPGYKKIRGVIIESSFEDFRGIAREKLADWWLTWPLQWPLSLAFNGDYSPAKAVSKLNGMPLLFIHGAADEIIPPHHSQRLFEAAHQPKEFWLIANMRHIEASTAPDVRYRLVKYIDKLPMH